MKQPAMFLLTAGALSMAGCYNDPVYAPAPAPPPVLQAPQAYGTQTPPVVQLGERNGYRAGFDDGARDAYYQAGYAPRRDVKYENAPGYDYRLGPIPPYVEAFRRAYLRGYDESFNRR